MLYQFLWPYLCSSFHCIKKSHLLLFFLANFSWSPNHRLLCCLSWTSRDSSAKVFAISFSFCCNIVAFSSNKMQGTSVNLHSFTPYFSRHYLQTYCLLLVNIPFLISSYKRHREHFWAVTCNFDLFSVWKSHLNLFSNGSNSVFFLWAWWWL